MFRPTKATRRCWKSKGFKSLDALKEKIGPDSLDDFAVHGFEMEKEDDHRHPLSSSYFDCDDDGKDDDDDEAFSVRRR
jgi:hypothetical protein